MGGALSIHRPDDWRALIRSFAIDPRCHVACSIVRREALTPGTTDRKTENPHKYRVGIIYLAMLIRVCVLPDVCLFVLYLFCLFLVLFCLVCFHYLRCFDVLINWRLECLTRVFGVSWRFHMSVMSWYIHDVSGDVFLFWYSVRVDVLMHCPRIVVPGTWHVFWYNDVFTGVLLPLAVWCIAVLVCCAGVLTYGSAVIGICPFCNLRGKERTNGNID